MRSRTSIAILNFSREGKGLPALFSRHSPQPDLSTFVAPSGGGQPLQLRSNEGTATAPANPPKNGLHLLLAGRPKSPQPRPDLCFLTLAQLCRAFILRT